MPDTEALDIALDEMFGEATFSPDHMGPMPGDTVGSPFVPLLDTLALARVEPVDEARAEEIAIAAEPPRWEEGLEPALRADHPGHNTYIPAIIALMTVLITYNFRHLKRLMSIYWEEATKIRRGRANVFDERPASDTPVRILLILQSIVCCALLLAGGLHRWDAGAAAMAIPALIAQCGVAVGAYYLLDYVAYNTVGYTFTDNQGRREWVRGFCALQALLGIALTIPAALAVFYPAAVQWSVLFGIFAWLAAKILFIIKGFRIFYDNFSGILYFILYLCTLEIIPLIWVYKISVY